MLWLGLHFPLLPLEIFAPTTAPFAVSMQHCVYACNAAARAVGIAPGMRIAAAQAEVPALDVRARDEAAEARLLDALAGWACQFSSCVSIAPQALLIEIGGSRALLGAPLTLQKRVRNEAAALGHKIEAAIAPTPFAAWFFARAGISGTTEPREIERKCKEAGLAWLPV